MRYALGLWLLFMTAVLYADTSSKLNIKTTDSSVSTYPYQLKVSPGTLTDNGDGTATLTTGGGGGGTSCGSNPLGIQFSDSNSCTWCETVSTAGNLVTALISCPAATVSRPCRTGMSLGVLLAVTCP